MVYPEVSTTLAKQSLVSEERQILPALPGPAASAVQRRRVHLRLA